MEHRFEYRFECGNVVQLNSAIGERMVVHSSDERGDCLCLWHNKEGTPCSAYYPSAMLDGPLEEKALGQQTRDSENTEVFRQLKDIKELLDSVASSLAVG